MKAFTILVLTAVAIYAAVSCVMAETEPAPQPLAPQATPVQPTMTTDQAMQNLGGVLSAFLQYAPTNDAQRRLAVESYNAVKAAMDRLATLEKQAEEEPK